MKIQFLGSGSAFVLANENYQSNILISHNNKHLLYDCGTTIGESLNNVELTPNDIDSIFISHLHADHSGGIEYMGFKTFFSTFPFGEKKIKLISNEHVLTNGWNHSWSGGMGNKMYGLSPNLATYFNPAPFKNCVPFWFEGTRMHPVFTNHTDEGRSYGLKFTEDKHTIFITGDTRFDLERMREHYNEATIIFHDCEFAEYEGGVHAQFHELCTLPDEIKTKMWLYHYSLEGKHIWDLNKLAEENGFAGIVRREQEFEL